MKNRLICLGTEVLFLGFMAAAALTAADQTSWVKGDVFAGIANGQYNVYTSAGVLKDTITDSSNTGYTTGCAFNPNFTTLYTTNFSQDLVELYDANPPHSIISTISTSANGLSNESVVFDQQGNFYVGHADGDRRLVKYSASGTVIDTYAPQTENRGTDWFDLAADQHTLFYTSEGAHVKRFDLATKTQLPDFALLPDDESYALRLLPPFDGSGGLLVANTSAVVRLDQNGKVVKSYTAPGNIVWFSMNLDPNGTSFWAGDMGTGRLYRFNIDSGAIEVGPIDTTSATNGQLNGVCVLGEIVAAVDTVPPVVQLFKTIPGPPTQVQLSSSDAQSGLASIEVTECTNCTAQSDSFTQGTHDAVITTATKTDPSQSSSIQLRVTDVAGNVTIFDPVDLTIANDGSPATHSVTVSPEEHIVQFTNTSSVVNTVVLTVNRRSIFIPALRANEVRTIDIGYALLPNQKNTVHIAAHGRKGSSILVLFTQP